MIKIEIKNQLQTKGYLKSLPKQKFESVLHLVFALFENYQNGQKEIFEIETLLDEIGYSNLKEISKTENEIIKKIILSRLQEWENQGDSETLSFKLMMAIQSQDIIVFIDDIIINDLQKPISLTQDSTISFINNLKINSISFTTL